MKNILLNKLMLLFALPVVLFMACNDEFLDQGSLSDIYEKDVYADSLKTLGVINNLYGGLNLSFNPSRFGNQCLEAACDEAEPSTDEAKFPVIIAKGAANPSNADKGIWTSYYRNVRQVNIFLANKDIIPVTSQTLELWEAHARFLKAWYSFIMLKHYGGFPLIGDKVYAEDEAIDVPRNTYAECVKYIQDELDWATSRLPLNNSVTGETADRFKATKGTTLAVKSRLLLYAASPLANGDYDGNDPDHYVSFGNSDKKRWEDAYLAAKAVIDLGLYSLYQGSSPFFYNLFQQNGDCSEHILNQWIPQNTNNNMYYETLANPPSRWTRYQSTSSSCFPLQELVDAFPMKNGLSIDDPTSDYPGIGDNMYNNRDPRLTASIHYNGALRYYIGSGDKPVRIYTGAIPASSVAEETSASRDGIYQAGATKTGYYRYKGLRNDVIGSGAELYRPQILIRYAEILLNAAEAANEYYGPTDEIYTWLRAVRQRAEITRDEDGDEKNLYGVKDNMTYEEMKIFIRNERRIELAFEEHRFWDVRRWKIAPIVSNGEVHGMEITRAVDGSFSYRVITIRKHVFNPEMYYWPIPMSEMTKSPALKQNQGYVSKE
ncbi:RagB/SusD family nutrient uptake outer membrane protein [termite gut metagenome]|uniref:RagB/SusD family nutrient uptake outer membrane protein n=1 Tax=termite gut metagenome TaxID=433724 RepID=A0A5J4SWI0_9ZZZZ